MAAITLVTFRERKLSTSPTSTQLGWSQNKFGNTAQMPCLGTGYCQSVCPCGGKRSLRQNPAARLFFELELSGCHQGFPVELGTGKGPTLASVPGSGLPTTTCSGYTLPWQHWVKIDLLKQKWLRKGLRRQTWQGFRSQKVKITLWHEAKSRLQGLSLLCELSLTLCCEGPDNS